MSDLPAGWIETTIGEVVEPKVEQRTPLENEHVYYIDISSIDRTAKKIVNPQKLSGKEAPSRARQVVASGDVLVSMTRPNLNAVAMVTDDLDKQIASTGFDVLRAKGVDSRWLYYLVRTNDFVTAMSDLVQGALYPAVRPRDIRNFEIPLAPLDEQKRIAEKLDTLLTRVDSCERHLERIPQILKRFRQSVLAAATSGRLTEEWREEKAVNGEWEESTFGETGSVSGGLTKNQKRNLIEWRKPYLRVANVYANKLELEDVAEIGLTQTEFEKTRLLKDDLLIVEGNGSLEQIGRAAIWNNEIADCVHQNHIIRWRTNGNVLPKFALFWLLSPEGRSYMVGIASSTTGLHTLSISKVSSIPIRLPSLEEQAEIVRRVGKLFAVAERLEARYLSARERVARLTPSLLGKGFRGELVEQDPNDEPAM